VHFDRRELDLILATYGRGVAAGVFRDYAMDGLSDRACFAIYERANQNPLYLIEKKPDLAAKQGAYAVRSGLGVILKRGHDLRQVLRFIDRPRFATVAD
jgi:hypothetical protein